MTTPSAGRTGERSHRRVGARAEQQARAFLSAQGYRLLEANHAVRGGEVDVVAMDGDVLCFVEVKAARGPGFGSALEWVTPRKRRRVVVAAQRWLDEHPATGDVRFDVVYRDDEQAGWVLVRDAFRADGPA